MPEFASAWGAVDAPPQLACPLPSGSDWSIATRARCETAVDQTLTAIFDSGEITGDFSQKEVQELVDVLNAGSLPTALSPQPISEIFTGGKYLIRVIFASLLVTLIAGLGMILLIVPGIILALMLCQFYCLIIDRDMGVIESLEASRTLMRGNKLTLFAVWLVTMICAPLAIVLTCCIGFFFVVPFVSLMMVVMAPSPPRRCLSA